MKNEPVHILIAFIIVTVVHLAAEGLATGAHALQGGSLEDDALVPRQYSSAREIKDLHL